MIGAPEDPVTGPAHCCLGPYWADKVGKNDVSPFPGFSPRRHREGGGSGRESRVRRKSGYRIESNVNRLALQLKLISGSSEVRLMREQGVQVERTPCPRHVGLVNHPSDTSKTVPF
nr:PhzF family phenazine biosynthesis protein [Geobacillus sp. BMUD]